MPDIERKIKIPPRRRSAILSVELGDGRRVDATVNARSVRLTVPAAGYGSAASLTLPRNADDIDALVKLLDGVIDEMTDQDDFAKADAESAAGGPPGIPV